MEGLGLSVSLYLSNFLDATMKTIETHLKIWVREIPHDSFVQSSDVSDVCVGKINSNHVTLSQCQSSVTGCAGTVSITANQS